jgi:uncharacterized protein (UPF0333 family)
MDKGKNDKMDQRGQISVEYILLAAIVMLIVIVFGWVIANESELNSVASAVKMGAENGTTYASVINPTMQPVRVTSVDTNGENNITIEVRFSSSVDSINGTILQSINRSLAGSGYAATSFGDSKLNLETSRHNYTVILI